MNNLVLKQMLMNQSIKKVFIYIQLKKIDLISKVFKCVATTISQLYPVI